jgi:hypothetical protein
MAIHRWKPDPENPVAAARCDASDFVVGNDQLIKQNQYMGTTLNWTGFWVAKRFADKPNPSAATPILRADPTPIPNPRPELPPDIIAGPWTYPSTS